MELALQQAQAAAARGEVPVGAVLLGPDGLGMWPAALATPAIAILDLVAKVAYGIIAMFGSRQVTTADLIRDEVSSVEIATHAIPSGALRPAYRK